MNKLELSQTSPLSKYFPDIPLVEDFSFEKLTGFQANKNRPIHRWFKYLQGFSADLVDSFLIEWEVNENHIILDPFCGVGTTLLSCQNKGIPSVGIDISPVALMAANEKIAPYPLPSDIEESLSDIFVFKHPQSRVPDYDIVHKGFGLVSLEQFLRLKGQIIRITNPNVRSILLFALGTIVDEVSLVKKDGAHYRYVKSPRTEDVFGAFKRKVSEIINDIHLRENSPFPIGKAWARVSSGDARTLPLSDKSIDFIITSPPYLNRDNYIAQSKLELFLLDLVHSFKEYRAVTFKTLQSHVEAKPFEKQNEILPIIKELLKVLKGRHYSNPKNLDMIVGYFSDMNKVIMEIGRVIKPGGLIALVIGNCCWSGVLIEVDKILATLARSQGLEVREIRVARYKLNSAQQIARYGKKHVRESILILENKVV